MTNPFAIGGGDPAASQLAQHGSTGPGYDNAYGAQMRGGEVGVSGYVAIPGQLPRADRYVKGEPMPQYILGDYSANTLQSVVTNALPWARINGVPDENTAVPGLQGPLTPLERQWIADMLAAEAT